MLSEPSYIPVLDIARAPVLHNWEEWDPYPALGLQNPDTLKSLRTLTDRAIIAYSIGCAEWVVYRFAGVSSDVRPFLFLEATWAYVMLTGVIPPPASVEDQWQGRVRAAIDMALMTVLNTIAFTETATAHTEGAFAELIALHVLPDPQSFNSWRKVALTRLNAFFPREKDHAWGPPVPREVLDPDFNMAAESQARSIAQFLARVSPETNEFYRLLA